MLCAIFLYLQAKRIAVAAEREAAFESMYGEVLSGLENAAGIMGDVQEELDHATKAHMQKQEQLYAEWSAEVFDKIQVGHGCRGHMKLRFSTYRQRSRTP